MRKNNTTSEFLQKPTASTPTSLMLLSLLCLFLLAIGLIATIKPAHSQEAPARLEPKIVNGTRASLGKYPWAVAIGSDTNNDTGYFCGGTLIHSQWVITAAHCFRFGFETDEIRILAGTVKLEKFIDGHQVEKILIHEKFNNISKDGYDLALVQLKLPINSSSDVAPIKNLMNEDIFEDSGHEESSTKYQINGFGSTSNRPGFSKYLLWAEVPALDTVRCNEPKSYNTLIKDDMICAGNRAETEASDSCKGDSGGGLIWTDDDGKQFLAGVTSWGGDLETGVSCSSDPYRVSVYVKLSSYFSEINTCLSSASSADCKFREK